MIKHKLFGMGIMLTFTGVLTGFVMAQDPMPSPTMSPTPIPSPTITPTPVPTPSPMMTPTPTPTPQSELIAQYSPKETLTTEKSGTIKDDKWTVVEYPEGKEVTVGLKSFQINNAKGLARIMRTADGTIVNLELSGLPTQTRDYYVYTVDEAGTVSLLDSITIENGINNAELKTPMSKFMLMVSPDENLTTYEDTSAIIFRSRIPQGYTVIPNG